MENINPAAREAAAKHDDFLAELNAREAAQKAAEAQKAADNLGKILNERKNLMEGKQDALPKDAKDIEALRLAGKEMGLGLDPTWSPESKALPLESPWEEEERMEREAAAIEQARKNAFAAADTNPNITRPEVVDLTDEVEIAA